VFSTLDEGSREEEEEEEEEDTAPDES